MSLERSFGAVRAFAAACALATPALIATDAVADTPSAPSAVPGMGDKAEDAFDPRDILPPELRKALEEDESAEKSSGASGGKKPDPLKDWKPREFELTEEGLKEYWDGLNDENRAGLEEGLAKIKDQHRILRFLAKYQPIFPSRELAAEVPLILASLAEGMEWTADAMNHCYGESIGGLWNDVLDYFNFTDWYKLEVIQARINGRPFDAEDEAYRKAFLEEARGLTRHVCQPEYRAYTEEFKRRFGTSGRIRPQDIIRATVDSKQETTAPMPANEADWKKVEAVHALMSSIFDQAYDQRAAFLALNAYRYAPFAANMEAMKRAGISVRTDLPVSDDALNYFSRRQPSERVFNYLAWEAKHFGEEEKLNFNSCWRSANVIEKLPEFNIPLTDEFAAEVKAEQERRSWDDDHLAVLALYVAEKEGLDLMASRYDLTYQQKSMRSLLEGYRDYVKKNPKGEVTVQYDATIQRPFDLLHDDLTKTMMDALMRSARKKDQVERARMEKDKKTTEEIQAELNRKRIADFMESAAVLHTVMSTWDRDATNGMLILAENGLSIDPDDFRFKKNQIKVLMTNYNRSDELIRDAVRIHQVFGIPEDMTPETLEAILGMDEEIRGKVAIAARRVIVPAFRELGITITGDNISNYLKHSDDLFGLWLAFVDVKTQEPDPQKVSGVRDLWNALNVPPPTDLNNVMSSSMTAQRLGRNIERKLAPLGQLVDQYGQDAEARHGMIRSLGIYLADKDTDEKVQRVLGYFQGKRPRLYSTVVKKYGVSGAPSDLLESTETFDEDLRGMMKPKFAKFVSGLGTNFGVEFKNFGDVAWAYRYYKNPELRAFLEGEDGKKFFQDARGRKKEYRLYHLDDMYTDYQDRDLLPYAEKLKNSYGITAGESEEEMMRDFSLTRAKTVGELDYLKRLRDLGFFADLDDPKTLQQFRAVSERFSLTMDRNALLTFLQVHRAPALYEKLMSDAFDVFLDELHRRAPALKFRLEMADEFMESFDAGPDFFTAVDRVMDAHAVGVETFEDLNVANLLAKTPALLAAVTEGTFWTFWDALSLKEPRLRFSDIPVVYELSQDGIALDDLYASEFNDFLVQVLQDNRPSVHDRVAMLPYYKNPEQRELLISEPFRVTLHAATRMNVSLSNTFRPKDVEIVLFLYEHPEVQREYENVAASGTDYIDRMLGRDNDGADNLGDTLQGFLVLNTDKKVEAYRGILEKCLSYAFHYGDGLALQEITRRFPDERAFQSRCERAAQNFGGQLPKGEKFRLNDLIILFGFGPEPSTDRNALEVATREAFTRDVRRTDSNLFGHASYNDPAKLNIFELNKLQFLREQLGGSEEIRRHIGEQIIFDVERDLTTELGGLVTYYVDDMGVHRLRFEYIPPAVRMTNGAYVAPREVDEHAAWAHSFSHNHATKYDSGGYASPSGSLFSRGGDLSVAENMGVDGVLVTSLAKGRFAVHFFTEQRDVVFVGVYEYPVSTQ